MNYQPCIYAMKWFRSKVFFSRDYSDIGRSILDYGEDKQMLQSIVNIAKIAINLYLSIHENACAVKQAAQDFGDSSPEYYVS